MADRRLSVGAALVATAVAGATLLTLSPAPAQDDTPTVVRVTASITPRPVNPKGETFFDETFSLRVAGEPVLMSNRSDGTGAFTVDDLMVVTVTRPDGQRQSLTHNFSNRCTKLSRSGPFDITGLTAPGINQVRVQMRDVCGVKVGSDGIWLYNLDPTPTPSPSPSTTDGPSPSPTATEEPSPSPSTTDGPSPSPTATEEPTPAPSPSESIDPTPSAEPSPSPTVLGITHHRTADVKWIAYIASRARDLPRCVANFVAGLALSPRKAAALCGVFHVTSNPRPPPSFSATSWSRFKRNKEYRSFIHIPRIDYGCSGDRISYFERSGLGHHEGYTPWFRIKFFWWRPPIVLSKSLYAASEKYTQRNLPFNAQRPKYYLSPDRRALTVSYLQASRLSKVFRAINYFGLPGHRSWLRTGYDAPFIWTYVRERITCKGAGVKFVSSSVPSRVLYLKGRRHTERPQSRDIAAFIRQGGRRFNRTGHGHLDRRCQKLVRTFWGRVSFPQRKGCLNEIPGW